jgi:nucleoside 2-deoxyribosyltransferase
MIKSKLFGHRVYLAGAMDRVVDGGKEWRDSITPMLRGLGLSVINPLNKPTEAGIENQETVKYKYRLKSNKNYDKLSEIMKEIRSIDLRMVDISDFLIVNLDIATHPCGTYEEIFWANRQKKPILIRMVQGKNKTPDWLFGTIPHKFIFDSWDEMFYYINRINTGIDCDTLNRWCFLDYGSKN